MEEANITLNSIAVILGSPYSDEHEQIKDIVKEINSYFGDILYVD